MRKGLRPGRQLCRDDLATFHEVRDGDAVRQKVVGDDSAMAAPPQRLGAHDGAAVAACERLELLEPGTERLRRRVVGVVAKGGISLERIGRRCRLLAAAAPAERDQMPISDTRCDE
jgi:hypothetical protein